MPSSAPADTVTATAMLARVRTVREATLAAEAELLELAVAWADSHPIPDDPWDEEHSIP